MVAIIFTVFYVLLYPAVKAGVLHSGGGRRKMLFYDTALAVYIIALVFITGLCVGSFLCCVSWRICHGEKFYKGRSHCPDCGHALSATDLIPLFSWLFLGGKCRYCHKKIPFRYPLSELVTGLVFVTVLIKFDITANTAVFLLLCSVLICIALCDLQSFIVPNGLLLCGVLVYIIYLFLSGDILHTLLGSLLGAAVSSVPLLLVSLLLDKVMKKDTLGGGDIKLFFVLGLFFDWKVCIFMVLFSCIAGLLFALAAMAVAKHRFKDIVPEREPDEVGTDDDLPRGAFPFAPAICFSGFVTLIFGEAIVAGYLSLFGL